MHLPLDSDPTFDDVANLFKKCGEIVLIRIVKHSGVVPSDLKQVGTRKKRCSKNSIEQRVCVRSYVGGIMLLSDCSMMIALGTYILRIVVNSIIRT